MIIFSDTITIFEIRIVPITTMKIEESKNYIDYYEIYFDRLFLGKEWIQFSHTRSVIRVTSLFCKFSYFTLQEHC